MVNACQPTWGNRATRQQRASERLLHVNDTWATVRNLLCRWGWTSLHNSVICQCATHGPSGGDWPHWRGLSLSKARRYFFVYPHVIPSFISNKTWLSQCQLALHIHLPTSGTGPFVRTAALGPLVRNLKWFLDQQGIFSARYVLEGFGVKWKKGRVGWGWGGAITPGSLPGCIDHLALHGTLSCYLAPLCLINF